MMCYRDRTFCMSDCINQACWRFLSDSDVTRANEMNLPIAWSNYSANCPDYLPPAED